MPSARGGHKVKPAKGQTEAPIATTTSKSTRWRTGLLKPALLSRNTSEPKLAGVVHDQVLPVLESSRAGTSSSQALRSEVAMTVADGGDTTHSQHTTAPVIPSASDVPIIPVIPNSSTTASEPGDVRDVLPAELEKSAQPRPSKDSISNPEIQEEGSEISLDTVEDLPDDDAQSTTSSSYSRDRLSTYSNDSASIYSSASSIYSSGASIYSLDEDCESGLDPRTSSRLQYPQRTLPRTVAVRRQEAQDSCHVQEFAFTSTIAIVQYFSTSMVHGLPCCTSVRRLLRLRGIYSKGHIHPGKHIERHQSDDSGRATH
jgi:hypothetical protein